MLTIAKIRRAARSLETEGIGINYPRLASLLNCSRDQVRGFVTAVVGLEEELNLDADRRFPGLVYMCAADNVRLRGEKVTEASLAQELGVQRSAVRMAFSRHPEWRKQIGVEYKRSSDIEKRERLYANLINDLILGGDEITISEIARRAHIDRASIVKDLQNCMPEMYVFLKRP